MFLSIHSHGPGMLEKAKSIVRALFSNHCGWADVLVVRGGCFSSHEVCFRANRVLENLLWNWFKMRRPYLVYQEGNEATRVCDPIPAWLTKECVYTDFCQCHIVGPRFDGRHHPVAYLGALYSNVVSRRHQLVGGRCSCSQAVYGFPRGYARNANNLEIATKLSRAMIHVLTDAPPSVPQRGEPLVSVLTSRGRKPKWERIRLRGLKKRLIERPKRRNARFKEDVYGEDNGYSFREEGIA